MMTLAGLLRPWEGRIRLDGEDVTKATAEQRAVLGIALVPEGRRIFSTLSIEENLLIGATSLRRRLAAAGGAPAARPRCSTASTRCSRSSATGAASAARICRAGSSRCSRSAAR